MKILNLYACLGGNRYKWGDEHEITAVEMDSELARMYQERFPNDTVIVGDAHQYLLDHFKEFDFIWSSPPCPTHSRARYWRHSEKNPKYPDMTLYQEIIFLKHHFEGKYCVENVIPYYVTLIPGKKRGRHIFWTNFNIPTVLSTREIKIGKGKSELQILEELHEVDIYKYKGDQRKDKIVRNMVDFEAGKSILDAVMGVMRKENENQMELF